MDSENSLSELLAQVRAGNQDAATKLVSRYEPLVRNSIRVRLRDERLRRLFDSMDLCQSVMGDFFSDLNKFEISSPQDLINLLITIVNSKVADKYRYATTKKRDMNRLDEGGPSSDLYKPGATPSAILERQETLDLILRELREDELRIYRLREQNLSWSEIAQATGRTEAAAQEVFRRALVRIRKMHNPTGDAP